jgi:multicomponent Na+:H+ antiporter subunit E
MRVFLLNLVLAALWAAAVGSVDSAHLVVGFAVGYGALWVARPLLGDSGYFRKVPQAARFALYFVGELVLSNLRVARDVLTPRTYRRPGVVAVPLDQASDVEVTLLANLVTLTPGTLSLDVAPDRTTLYVHAMFVDDVESLRRQVKDGFERRVLELLR